MPEIKNGQNVNTDNGSLSNIKRIEEFIKRNQSSIMQLLATEKNKLEIVKQDVKEKRHAIIRELEEKKALEEARLKQIEEAKEALRAASSAPIELDRVENTNEPAVEETVEETSVVETVEKTEIVIEEKPVEVKPIKKVEVVAPTVPKVEKKPNVKPQQPIRKEEDRQNIKQINAAKEAAQKILGTTKKQSFEAPVIRVYIPPVEQQSQRPSRGEKSARPGANNNFRDKNTQGSSNSSTYQRPQNAIEQLKNVPVFSGNKDTSKKKFETNTPEEKTQLDRKSKLKKGLSGGRAAVEYDDEGNVKKIRSRKTGSNNKSQFNLTEVQVIEHAILTKDNFTIKELAEKIGKSGTEIIKRLFQLGIMKTINDKIDFETAELVAGDLGITIELQKEQTSEDILNQYFEEEEEDEANLVKRPPIVTIMGHVDHGKTSILDYIKKSKVALGEAGGITQHISAYSITVNGSQISFLDTPGHAAFSAMRARGANVTDIVVIVVAADDGIMPQTVEVINHAKAAKECQIIVAINKIDKNTADPDRVMTQLTEHGLVPEAWGGDVPVVKVSAKTGEGIDELLETILLVADVMELKANPNRNAKGTVVEARLDKGKGPLATILVQTGTLKVGDHVAVGIVAGKIRAMQDDKGRNVKTAGPSTAVVILGLDTVPEAGDQLMASSDEKLIKSVVEGRKRDRAEGESKNKSASLDDLMRDMTAGEKKLNIIIKADVQGSVEALKESLVKLSTDEVKVAVIHDMVGAINESDINLAKSSGAIIIGFNVRPDAMARDAAETQKVEIRLYRIIYDAIDDVTAAIKGLSAPKFREQYLGKAEVRQTYKISSIGTIAGCMVLDGKIVRNAKVRLIRDNIIIADTAINSLKRMKDDMKEVAQGYECGIGLENWNDIIVGDIIESFEIVEEKR